MRKTMGLDDCFFGAATVGERGQVVIPAEARHEMDIKAGDKLLIMRHPELPGLVIAKFEDLKGFIDDFQQKMVQASQQEEQGS